MRPLLVSLVLLFSLSATAATFTVSNTNDIGPGSLRQAIVDANFTPGRDSIVFTVPALVIGSPEPAFIGPVDIDGNVSGSRVSITSNCCGFDPLLRFSAGSSTSTVQNLATSAVQVDAGVTGVTFTSNAIFIPYLRGDANTVIGDVSFDGDIEITGSNNVVLSSRYTSINVVGGTGNRVGNLSGGGNMSIAGMNVLGSTNAIIEGNRFTSGGPWGLFVYPGSEGAVIRGNTVGNKDERAFDIRSSNVLVEDNTFENQYGAAISVTAATGVTITRNSLSLSQTHVPIDLGFNGATTNDALDADTGANNLQNYPVITSAQRGATALTVNGSIASLPLTTFTIELFSSPSAGEAQTFLGSTTVTTDASGNGTFTATITSPLPAIGEVITATATNQGTGDTSEISAATAVVAAPAVAAEPIPTLSESALIALAGALVAIVMLRLR